MLRALVITLLVVVISIPTVLFAAPTKVKFKLYDTEGEPAAGYSVVLVDGNGRVTLKVLGATGSFAANAKKLAGATLALLDQDGRALGPIVIRRNLGLQRAYLGFSGKLVKDKKSINLGRVDLKTEGLALPSKNQPASIAKKAGLLVANTDQNGVPEGASTGGLSVTSLAAAGQVKINAGEGDGLASAGADSDADGIIDALDPDVDGDGIVNIADEDFAGNDDATFSSLVLDYNNTLNANIGSVTQDDIDDVISGENLFSIGFWYSLPPESELTGGHVICSDSNLYCNSTDGTAVYGGLSESDGSLVGQPWINLNQDGSGHPNMEFLNISGGTAIAAAIQPRADTSAVRPGDTYLVNFTNGSGEIVENKLLVLSTFLVTSPAVKSFTVDSTTTNVDYSDPSNTIGSNGTPAVTNSSGLITINFYRPQRLLYRTETPSSETDRYRDMGRLQYGLVFEGVSSQFTCGGLYSNLSSDLTEDSTPLGTGDSPLANQGANLFPLRDGSDDAVPSTSRTLTLTVDLRTCLTRASQSVGTYTARLIAQGEELSGGANSSSQMFKVTVQ